MNVGFQIFCAGCLFWHFPFVDTSHEILPGVKVYDCFGDFEGQLVFVAGKTARGGSHLPMARVMTCDLRTMKTEEVLQVPQPVQLSVSSDGTWAAAILTDINMLAPAEVLLFSLTTRETRRLSYPSAELQVVIVSNQMFVRTGTQGNGRIEVYDIATGTRTKLALGKIPPAQSEDYFFVKTRVSDSRTVYIGYDPGGATGGLEKGLYAYDIASHKAERVGAAKHFCDLSLSGEFVCWESYDSGAALMAYKSFADVLAQKPQNEGRLLLRDRHGRYNFCQVSPCQRFAVLDQQFFNNNGISYFSYLCDLRSGKCKLFVEAKAAEKEPGAFVGDVHWVRKPPARNE